MKQIKPRTVLEGVEHHKQNPVRVYANDGVQDSRIAKARRMVNFSLLDLGHGSHRTIVELGCGVLDISGPFSQRANHEVIGVECNAGCAARAHELYPAATLSVGTIEDVEPFKCDVLVLCEVLEHLADPLALVAKWLPLARTAVISHPLDEELNSPLSAGDHCWSFSDSDLLLWFVEGGHKVVKGTEKFQMGCYTIGIARGIRA